MDNNTSGLKLVLMIEMYFLTVINLFILYGLSFIVFLKRVRRSKCFDVTEVTILRETQRPTVA